MSEHKPPKHLSAEARALWRDILRDFVLDDAAALRLLQSACESYDRMQDARALVAKEGVTVRDKFGQPKPHPACAIERDARTLFHQALKQLNLDMESPGKPGRPGIKGGR